MIPPKPKGVTWTCEQWQAIYDDDKNIIVSAGAGSGKTAVLTERVIRKLKDGVHINELLILTFTKAAAQEMADRIRKKIKKIPELAGELNLLDAAYITTFDSFALSTVKKYHYLLNVSDSIGIIDASVINIYKNKVMEDIFLELYEKRDPLFLKMIKSFCIKDDDDIKRYILTISNKLDLLSNKREYLDKYLDSFYDAVKIDRDIDSYMQLIFNKRELIRDLVREISYIDNEYASKLSESLEMLYESSCYDDLVSRLNLKLPSVPRGSCSEVKNLKGQVSDIVKEIKALAVYKDSDEIRDAIYATRDTVQVIISIILEFTKRISDYKRSCDFYEFNDIAIMAIDILKNNSDVRDEIRNSFNEIMIDEYQDTNDLQEEFISMISSHNVYMVGDIKQSIYRFRNANPYIFKNKYDDYSVSNRDSKIDLNKNFRSREEVIDNINVMFNLIMDDVIGGADYLKSHQMVFGNKAYLKEELEHSNDMDVYTYEYDRDSGFSKEEIEAFIIARDIKEKYDNKYQVFDKDTGCLRDITYSDFSIIMDRATSFSLYKKVLSYFGINATILKDESMNDADDIKIIKNLIKFIIKIKDKVIDQEFKYLFISIMRSFLFSMPDNDIFNYFLDNSYMDSDLYKKCFEISSKLDYITIRELLDLIVDKFNYYDKLIEIGNVEGNLVKLDKLMDMASNLEDLGYDIYSFSTYLTELLEQGYSIDYKVNDNGSESVKIMTIHKSKGLEYPICYFSGLYKSFNIRDLNEKFLVDKDFGIIVPYFKGGIGQTIYKELLRDKYIREEISEKIRLFYVALTRAREKMILVRPYSDKVNDACNDTVLGNNLKIGYRSILDIVNSVEFRIKDKVRMIDVSTLGLSRDYNLIKAGNYQDSIDDVLDELVVDELEIDNDFIDNQSFSKKEAKLISKREYKNMEFGRKIHEVLEYIDFKKPNYDLISDDFSRGIVRKLLESDKMANIECANIYKEYEFVYDKDNVLYHGVIDLMLEYDDYIDIIDYKLKNVSDEGYIRQLQGYCDYIKTCSGKRVNLYLYSLMDSEFSAI